MDILDNKSMQLNQLILVGGGAPTLDEGFICTAQYVFVCLKTFSMSELHALYPHMHDKYTFGGVYIALKSIILVSTLFFF